MNRFSKLMSTMGDSRRAVNPGIDQELIDNSDKINELSMIDDKIAQLEESQDPNALESIEFWKQRRDKLAAKLAQ